MKKFMNWYLEKMITLCDYALRHSDLSDGIHDINEVVAIRNYFIRQRPTNEA